MEQRVLILGVLKKSLLSVKWICFSSFGAFDANGSLLT